MTPSEPPPPSSTPLPLPTFPPITFTICILAACKKVAISSIRPGGSPGPSSPEAVRPPGDAPERPGGPAGWLIGSALIFTRRGQGPEEVEGLPRGETVTKHVREISVDCRLPSSPWELG